MRTYLIGHQRVERYLFPPIPSLVDMRDEVLYCHRSRFESSLFSEGDTFESKKVWISPHYILYMKFCNQYIYLASNSSPIIIFIITTATAVITTVPAVISKNIGMMCAAFITCPARMCHLLVVNFLRGSIILGYIRTS